MIFTMHLLSLYQCKYADNFSVEEGVESSHLQVKALEACHTLQISHSYSYCNEIKKMLHMLNFGTLEGIFAKTGCFEGKLITEMS